MNQPWIYMCSPSQSPLPPPSPSHPSGSSQCTSPEHLSHVSNLGWSSVSPLIVYLFQCCSLRMSHPRLLPQSPKVCSVHLRLFFCFTYRVIITVFLNSIYVIFLKTTNPENISAVRKKVFTLNLVILSCDPMDCSLAGSSVHGFLQARILEWVTIPFSRESFWPRAQTRVSHIAGRFFTIWATREALD